MGVLVLGATGFVGRHLHAYLASSGHDVVGASRDAESAHRRFPGRRWIQADVDDPEALARAMRGQRAVVYLVHRMGETGNFASRERRSAERVRSIAEQEGVERIIYLGGVAPQGEASAHLQSRLDTGAILRAGPVPTVELRAGMIVGVGSESWRIVRDLAVRLPVMLLPRWLENRSQPIALADVMVAIEHSLDMPLSESSVFDIPGPDTLSSREVLERIAALRGTRPVTMGVPVLTPRLSSYWIRAVTRADFAVARELVEGLTSDLIARDDSFWQMLPEHRLMSFDEAAARALHAERVQLTLRTRLFEGGLRRLARNAIAT